MIMRMSSTRLFLAAVLLALIVLLIVLQFGPSLLGAAALA
jgi:hypothetical protein